MSNTIPKHVAKLEIGPDNPLTNLITNDDVGIRCLGKNGDLWFVLHDIADYIGDKTYRKTIVHPFFKREGKQIRKMNVKDGQKCHDVNMIQEAGAYAYITIKYKLNKAADFLDWLSEIARSLRMQMHAMKEEHEQEVQLVIREYTDKIDTMQEAHKSATYTLTSTITALNSALETSVKETIRAIDSVDRHNHLVASSRNRIVFNGLRMIKYIFITLFGKDYNKLVTYSKHKALLDNIRKDYIKYTKEEMNCLLQTGYKAEIGSHHPARPPCHVVPTDCIWNPETELIEKFDYPNTLEGRTQLRKLRGEPDGPSLGLDTKGRELDCKDELENLLSDLAPLMFMSGYDAFKQRIDKENAERAVMLRNYELAEIDRRKELERKRLAGLNANGHPIGYL